MFKFLHSKKGFTLVELMVVVAILGVLFAIGIPVYRNTQKNAKIKICSTKQSSLSETLTVGSIKGKLKHVERTDVFTLTTNTDGTAAEWGGTNTEGIAEIEALFAAEEETPFCLEPGAVITVTFVLRDEPNAQNYFEAYTSCSVTKHPKHS